MWEKIEQLLKERKITVVQLSMATNIPKTTIYTWKNGKTKPTSDKLAEVAHYFGVSTDYLLGKTDNPSPKQDIEQMSEHERKAYEVMKALNDRQLELAIAIMEQLHKMNDVEMAISESTYKIIKDLQNRRK